MMISLEQISYVLKTQSGWKSSARPLLSRIHLQVQPGEFVGILGSNGSGKSTLLKMMAGLIPPDQGKVLCNVRRSYLAQSLQNREDLPLTVDDYLHLGPELLKCHSSEDLTKQLYQYFDVQDLKLRFLDELSGGQFQRIQLMKALFVQPELLLLDEPLNSLDEKFQVLTMDYLKTWKQQGKSVVAVLHDEDLAKKYCDRLFILHCEHLIPWDQRGAHGC